MAELTNCDGNLTFHKVGSVYYVFPPQKEFASPWSRPLFACWWLSWVLNIVLRMSQMTSENEALQGQTCTFTADITLATG
jgi:hypothetical protein